MEYAEEKNGGRMKEWQESVHEANACDGSGK